MLPATSYIDSIISPLQKVHDDIFKLTGTRPGSVMTVHSQLLRELAAELERAPRRLPGVRVDRIAVGDPRSTILSITVGSLTFRTYQDRW